MPCQADNDVPVMKGRNSFFKLYHLRPFITGTSLTVHYSKEGVYFHYLCKLSYCCIVYKIMICMSPCCVNWICWSINTAALSYLTVLSSS